MKDSENDNKSLSDEAKQLLAEIEQWGADSEAGLEHTTDQLEAVRVEMEKAAKGMNPKAIGPDSPVPLARAVCLPVFGGVLAEEEEYDRPGPAVTVDKMRVAINRGLLNTTAIDAKNRFITPRQAEEWIAACQTLETTHSKTKKVVTAVFPSSRTRPTSRSERERDAMIISQKELALARATKLKESLKRG